MKDKFIVTVTCLGQPFYKKRKTLLGAIKCFTTEYLKKNKLGEDYSNCIGRTEKDGYLAFYHERRLYSVEHEDSGIISLVYAKSPFEAIDLVDEFRRKAGDQSD